MASPLFHGVITALVTPFRNGAVDLPALLALVERQVAAGVAGVAPTGTTGEAPTLSEGERRQVVERVVKAAAGRVRVLAGAGANDTPLAIERVRHAKAVGADGALVVTPYYNRPSQQGLRAHYLALADAVELPLVLYNVPARTGVDLANDTVARLAEHPNVVGLKDATGDVARASQMRLTCPEDFALLSGDDASALGYLAQGGHGVISVTSNLAPELCVRQAQAAARGDREGALALQDRLIALHRALFADNSPAPAKWGLAQLGLCAEEVRAPLGPCGEAAQALVRAAMDDAGLRAGIAA